MCEWLSSDGEVLAAEIEAELEEREAMRTVARRCREEAREFSARHRAAVEEGTLDRRELAALRLTADHARLKASQIERALRGLT